MDLFIDDRVCARCLRKFGIDCTACRGRRWADGTCKACLGTGLRRDQERLDRLRRGSAEE